jgi:hypothetical protein
MVFDHAGQNLYIADGDGLIKTFNLSTRTFQRTYNLGGWLWGIDIAPDDSFIVAAQASYTLFPPQATFQRVNLASGAITNINYIPDSAGSWDIKIASNGLALATAHFAGSGWTWLRQIDLSTNAITIRSDAPGSGAGGQVRGDTQIYRSADGTRLLFMESDISSGPTFTYSANTNTFGPSFSTNAFRDWAGGAVNRNGNLVAVTTGYYGTQTSLYTAPSFHDISDFNGLESGLAFDGVRDILYGVNTATDQIVAYSTPTFAELFRLAIGEAIGPPPITQFDTGTLVASTDGHWLALETDSGIRLFDVANPPIAVPPNPRAVVADFNGDGHPDLVARNVATQQTGILYLNNNVVIGVALAPLSAVVGR